MLQIGQKQRTQDFAQLLAGQEGTFLVSRPGTPPLVVVCQQGYSIRSIRSAGSDYPTIPLGGSSNVWEVEKLNSSTEVAPEIEIRDNETRQRQSQGAQAQNR